VSKKELFIGKKCKVYYNDFPDHVAHLTGKVISYDSDSKEVIIKNEYNGKTTSVTRIRMEVIE
jgi:hypothetical protein